MRRWDTLSDIIIEHDISTFVEVGTARGKNLRNIFDIIGDRHISIWCIDPYEPYEGYDENEDANADPKRITENYELAKDRIFSDDRVTHIRDYSLNAANLFQDESVELIFVDANHEKEFVKEDLEAWWPKVKPGYFLAGHDYTWEYVSDSDKTNGVIEATDEFLEEQGLKMYHHDKERTFVLRKA